MTNVLELKIAIMRSELSRQEIADRMGISLTSLHKKINGRVEFKASEIQKLTYILDLNTSDKEIIFFT